MRTRKLLLLAPSVVLALFFVFVAALCVTLSPQHTFRCLRWLQSDIKDYEKFPAREIANQPPVFHFQKNPQESLPSALSGIGYTHKGQEKKIDDLDEFLRSNQSTAFIVIKDDQILYENYFNGYTRDSINTSFSMAKSFDSALVGIAIDEGYIRSVDDPVIEYIPELKGRSLDTVTVRHLLMMASGINYYENGLPWGHDALTYYYPDLRKIALTVRPVEEPGRHFLYDNYHPLLIGMILERATGRSVSEYLAEKIWKPLGMEYPASWSLDSERTGFEKMESGINARSIDFAKFGRLFLNKGEWNGRRIISEEWVLESTSPPSVADYGEYYKSQIKGFFHSGKGYYKYFWWGYQKEDGAYDFIAAGHLGQYVYVCPAKKLILVRNGKKLGKVDDWREVLRTMTEKL
jgi:CubicO group peptidase (beta-lactamase class C family)